MAKVGYRLVKTKTGAKMAEWGGIWGQCPEIPNPLVLPNGNQVCAPVVGKSYGGYRLEEWHMGPGVEHVKAECRRRIVCLTGATDFEGSLAKQANAASRRLELLEKRVSGSKLTKAEAAELVEIQERAIEIDRLRARSAEIEVMNPIPDDLTNGALWE